MSVTRRRYILRLCGRILAFFLCLAACFFKPEWFGVLEGWRFFKEFSPLHILWAVWVIDMILQILPIKSRLALGSQKLFANRFRPIREKISKERLKNHAASAARAAYKVMIIWGALTLILGALYLWGPLNRRALFMIAVLFYVCDLICVLIWCPFRLIMKNKCCTTCRIFNWDHLMMFLPLCFMGGFFSLSLVGMAVLAFLVWELCTMIYPERFWEVTNVALQCCECTDKLCTQYCQKLR